MPKDAEVHEPKDLTDTNPPLNEALLREIEGVGEIVISVRTSNDDQEQEKESREKDKEK